MRIVIDLQGAQTESRFRGIGRYSLSLAKAMARNRGHHEFIIALSGLFPDTIEPIRAALEGLLPEENIHVWHAPWSVRESQPGNIWRRKAAERIRESFLASLRPDVVHVTSLFEGFVDDAVTSIGVLDKRTPTVVTLYDLIPLLNSEHYLRQDRAYEQYYLRKVQYLERAFAWLAISDSTKREGIECLGLREDRVFNISAACDECFRRIEMSAEERADLLGKYGISRPFLLYTGAADIHKNVHSLIRAYAMLTPDLRRTYQLVLAGKIPENERLCPQSTARSAGLSVDELILTGYITDEELLRLYNLCKLFVFPSYHEGFGMPLLEAMSCGAPVIASNVSSLPEIVDREDVLFNPYSEESIASRMAEVLTNDALRDELRLHGLQQARRFSWDESAKRAIASLETIYAEYQNSCEIAKPLSCRPKLAYISPLPPERTGISDYSAELLPELARHYDIEVIVSQPEVLDPWVSACLPIRSVEYFEKNVDLYDRILYHIGNSPFHKHMLNLLDRFPGVVVLHDFYLGNIIAHQELGGQSPGIWTGELYESHGYKAVWERFHMQDAAKLILKYPCNFSVIQRALGVIVHSAYSVGMAREWYEQGNDWAVIPHLRASPKSVDRMATRRRLGIGEDCFLVCSFGILDPVKKNHNLLTAWLSSSLARDPRCQLIFVGENHDGDYGKQLLKTICDSDLQQRIRITGWANAETFKDYLGAADIAVQLRTLSRGETSGTVLDCMSFGLPTIVNANGSMAELPKDAVYMLPDDFRNEELIEALEILWQDSGRREALGAQALQVIMTSHLPRACAQQYMKAIEKFYAGAQTDKRALIDALARLEDLPADVGTIATLATSIAQSLPLKHPARLILIDVSALAQLDLKTGVERVTRSILLELLHNPPSGCRVEPVYATASSHGYRYARRFALSLLRCPPVDWTDEPIEPQAGDIFLGLDLNQFVVKAQADYLESLRRCGVRIFFVVYDLLPILMPEAFPQGIDQIHKEWLRSVSHVSEGVICISRTVADDAIQWLMTNAEKRLRPLKIGWLHIGADIEKSAAKQCLPDDASHILAQLAARPSFLMVGTIEPRKGYLQTIAAFEQLWKEGVDVNLVIVGMEGWKDVPGSMRRTIPEIVERLRRNPELGRRLLWLEGINDEYLEGVYTACACLICASEGEGFGLPLIEAAQHKLPLIIRDIPVFREVAGKHAFYFSGKEPSDLANVLKVWLRLRGSNQHPRSDDLPWLTWKQCTEKMLDIILRGHWYTDQRQTDTSMSGSDSLSI